MPSHSERAGGSPEVVTVESLEADVSALLLHIDHLVTLGACLRIGKHPSETFWNKFDRSKALEAEVRQRACERQGGPNE